MKYNIFQGSDIFTETISKALMQKQSRDIYFDAFFYLTKRFGMPSIEDVYKDAGVWSFEVKNYTIQIYISSSNVNFMIFGDRRLRNIVNYSSYHIKYWRERDRKRHLLINNWDFLNNRSEYESQQLQNLFVKYLKENEIPEDINMGDFNSKYGGDFWYKEVDNFNLKILVIDREAYEKYGEYSNAKTRHALKTVRQFIHNMLTPIWVRDCAFNICGRIDDKDIVRFEGYENNIKIEEM